jgi:NAD(P)H-hydrate epimerase
MGVPSAVLMERAALACVERLQRGDFNLTSTLCLCGTGNNGGDGMAIARLLHLAGHKAAIVLVGDQKRLSADAKQQLIIAKNYGVPIIEYSPGRLEGLAETETAPTIVDALFGVGLSRPVEGDAHAAISEASALARRGAKVLAVDIPSGVSADSGEALGIALEAHATVTFAFNKIGLTKEPGKTMAGDLTVADIGIYAIDRTCPQDGAR